METKTIKIIVSPKKTSEGRSFLAYRAVTAHGRLITCKFNQTVTNPPQETCYITCLVSDLNVDTSKEYPVLWVKAIQSTKAVAEAQAEKSAEKVNHYFD